MLCLDGEGKKESLENLCQILWWLWELEHAIMPSKAGTKWPAWLIQRNSGYLYLSPQTQSLFTWNVHRIIIELDQFIDSQFRFPDSSGRNWFRAYIFPCMLFYFHIQLITLSWITNAKDVLMEHDWTSCSNLPASSSVLVPLFAKSRL